MSEVWRSWPDNTLPAELNLHQGCVHVWRAQLDQPTGQLAEDRILSADEIARAARFRFDVDRLRFVRCRSVLRQLLGQYARTPADEIRFAYQRSGKPELPIQSNPSCLHFNISHSADMALFAFALNRPVGVDIEQIRSDLDIFALADQFFSSRECAQLRALPEELHLPGFFACWTRKESLLKATGAGFSLPLSDFSVTAHPGLHPCLEEFQGDTAARKQWCLNDISVGQFHRAALAIEGAACSLQCFRWALPKG